MEKIALFSIYSETAVIKARDTPGERISSSRKERLHCDCRGVGSDSTKGETRIQGKDVSDLEKGVQWRTENFSWNKMHFFSFSFSLSFSLSTAVVHVCLILIHHDAAYAQSASPLQNLSGFLVSDLEAFMPGMSQFPTTSPFNVCAISFYSISYSSISTSPFIYQSVPQMPQAPQIYVTSLALVPFPGTYRGRCQWTLPISSFYVCNSIQLFQWNCRLLNRTF